MSSTTTFSTSPRTHRSPLSVITSWTHSHLSKSKSCHSESQPSSPSSSSSSSSSHKYIPPALRGENIRFHGSDAPSSPPPLLERKFLKGLLKRGVHILKAKIIYDSSFCQFLASTHGSTVQELVIVCRKPEALNEFIGTLPLFTSLRTLEIQLEATLRVDAGIAGLARIPTLPNISTLKINGWNRDLWSCLGRVCTNLTALQMVDLQGVYEGQRQCDIIQRMIDNNQSTLQSLRISLFYETGLNLQSLHNLTNLTISIPLMDKREEDGERTHEMIPASKHLSAKILDQQLNDGSIVTEVRLGTATEWEIESDFV